MSTLEAYHQMSRAYTEARELLRRIAVARRGDCPDVMTHLDCLPDEVAKDQSVIHEGIDQRRAALAIHAPCHDADTEPWGCVHGHADAEAVTGIPDAPGVCVACTYDDRTVTYPCPTAQALGVTA